MQVVASPGPALTIVAKAVAGVPTCTERLVGNTAANSWIPVAWFCTKLAEIVVFAFNVMVHGVIPTQPPPLQPAKVELAAATAEITICVPV